LSSLFLKVQNSKIKVKGWELFMFAGEPQVYERLEYDMGEEKERRGGVTPPLPALPPSPLPQPLNFGSTGILPVLPGRGVEKEI
jgi:hypothetical protein